MGDQPPDTSTSPEPPNGAEHPDRRARHSLTALLRNLSRKSLAALGAVLTAIVASLVTAVVIGWFSGGHAPTLTHTSSIIYQPWTLNGKLSGDLHITARVTGFCWTESIATPRLDAYRCMTGNNVLDPCFAGPDGPGNEVACPYPSPDSVTLMKLTRSLPYFPPPGGSSSPWLLILADGERCYHSTGGTMNPGGLRLDYECGHSSNNLYGNIDRAGRIWTIFQERNGSVDMTQARIAEAYY